MQLVCNNCEGYNELTQTELASLSVLGCYFDIKGGLNAGVVNPMQGRCKLVNYVDLCTRYLVSY